METLGNPPIIEQDFEFNFTELETPDLIERIRQFDTAIRTIELPEEDREAMDRECKHMVFEYYERKRRDQL